MDSQNSELTIIIVLYEEEANLLLRCLENIKNVARIGSVLLYEDKIGVTLLKIFLFVLFDDPFCVYTYPVSGKSRKRSILCKMASNIFLSTATSTN